MFTGIVSDVGRIVRVDDHNDVRRLAVASSYEADSIDIGASIICAGICLTVVAREPDGKGGSIFDVEAAPETLAVTSVQVGRLARASIWNGRCAWVTNSAGTW